MSGEQKGSKFGAAGLLICLAAILFVVLVNTSWLVIERAWVFLTLALLAIAAMSLGAALNGRPLGLVIDNRNRASLSKLQMRQGRLAPPATRIVQSNIDIPGELLAAMGIAAGSFVAAPAVLSLKANETPTTDNLNKAGASALAHGGS